MSRLMRCSRVGGVILYSFDNGHFMAYTSPPPPAEPLLKEKPFGECTFQLSPIAVQRLHSYSTRPRGTPILIGAGLAKPDRRGNIQVDGWRLRRSGHAEFSLPRGRGGSAASHFNSTDFHVTHRFFVSFPVRPALLPYGKRGFRAAICKIARPQPPAAAL